jgi:hypothetical protein
MSDIKLKVLVDTFFKEEPKQGAELTEDQKVFIEDGKEFSIHSYDMSLVNGHVKVALKDVFLGPKNRTTWFIYPPHVEIGGNEPNNKPNDAPAPNTIKISSSFSGPKINLPGHGSVYLCQPILANGHFSWAEATKNGTRVPNDATIVKNIIKVAKVMEEVREYVGAKPITINSWYRDPESNRKAGGSARSRHMAGDAVDFVVAGIAPPKVNQMLDGWWGSRGGIASASCFTHIDARGYRARWSYGF